MSCFTIMSPYLCAFPGFLRFVVALCLDSYVSFLVICFPVVCLSDWKWFTYHIFSRVTVPCFWISFLFALSFFVSANVVLFSFFFHFVFVFSGVFFTLYLVSVPSCLSVSQNSCVPVSITPSLIFSVLIFFSHSISVEKR